MPELRDINADLGLVALRCITPWARYAQATLRAAHKRHHSCCCQRGAVQQLCSPRKSCPLWAGVLCVPLQCTPWSTLSLKALCSSFVHPGYPAHDREGSYASPCNAPQGLPCPGNVKQLCSPRKSFPFQAGVLCVPLQCTRGSTMSPRCCEALSSIRLCCPLWAAVLCVLCSAPQGPPCPPTRGVPRRHAAALFAHFRQGSHACPHGAPQAPPCPLLLSTQGGDAGTTTMPGSLR